MNTLLINISLRPEMDIKYFPIGIGYIATAMARAGYEFDLIDIEAARYTDDEVDRLIEKRDYDVVCLGTLVTGYKFVKDLCARIRRRHPACTIIVGNSVATSIYEMLLTKTEADVAVMGEGDVTIVETLKALEKGEPLESVAGLYLRKDGRIVKNPVRETIADISTLPFLNFSLFDVEHYITGAWKGLRVLPVNTARGCVARCTFCYHVFKENKYRYRSAASIVAEIEDMIRRYAIGHIAFHDELTIFSRKRAEELADAILKSKERFSWEAKCRADCFTGDADLGLLMKLREAGCRSLGYSLESSSKEILSAMNKNITVEQFEKTTELVHKAGISPATCVIVGYPQETPETIRDTFDVCARSRIYPSTGYLLPQPGSVMYDYAREHGFIRDEEEYLLRLGDRQDLRLNMTSMTDLEMEEAVVKGLRKCNEVLKRGLSDERLIKNMPRVVSKAN